MVIEFVRAKRSTASSTRSGPLAPAHAVEFTIKVLGALAHAHSMGVVHRDLKPQNIMVTEAARIKIRTSGALSVPARSTSHCRFSHGNAHYRRPSR